MDLLGLYGALHPALVHVPLGGIAAAVLLEAVSWRDSERVALARRCVLSMSASVGVLAVLAGFQAQNNQGYSDATVAVHQWMALLSVALASAAAIADWRAIRAWLRRALVASTAVAMAITGHCGGLISDPERYDRFLSSTSATAPVVVLAPVLRPASSTAAAASPAAPATPQPDLRPRVAAASAPTWAQVAAILEERCLSCHNAVKRKGGLRVDAYEHLSKVSLSRIPPVTPGQPQGSPLYQRVVLPSDHEDRMPPASSGPPLSDEQSELIRAWIVAGAPGPISTTRSAEVVADYLARASERRATVDPDQPHIDRLRAFGAQVWNSGSGLGVSLRHVPGTLDSKVWQALDPLAARVVALDLTGRSLDLADCGHLAKCLNVQRLDLTRASLPAEGFKRLHACRSLSVVVLVGTILRGDGDAVLTEFTQVRTWYMRGSASAAAVKRTGVTVVE